MPKYTNSLLSKQISVSLGLWPHLHEKQALICRNHNALLSTIHTSCEVTLPRCKTHTVRPCMGSAKTGPFTYTHYLAESLNLLVFQGDCLSTISWGIPLFTQSSLAVYFAGHTLFYKPFGLWSVYDQCFLTVLYFSWTHDIKDTGMFLSYALINTGISLHQINHFYSVLEYLIFNMLIIINQVSIL